MVLDRNLTVGASGGHGKIRYTCTAHIPARLPELTFDDVNGSAVDGRLDQTHCRRDPRTQCGC